MMPTRDVAWAFLTEYNSKLFFPKYPLTVGGVMTIPAIRGCESSAAGAVAALGEA